MVAIGFLVIGVSGLVVALIPFVLRRPAGAGVPAVGGFLAAFGLVSALVLAVGSGDGSTLSGLLAAGLVGTGTAIGVRQTARLPRSTEPDGEGLVGRRGTVLVDVGADREGRVGLDAPGERIGLSASSPFELPAGTDVVVVAVTGPTSVRVAPTELRI